MSSTYSGRTVMSAEDRPSTEHGSPRNPKNMKAIGFEVEEMMKLFLVMIIGLAVVILVISASGGISSMLADFCNKNPAICGATSNACDYNLAKDSFDALVTAHNCILDPASCGCISKSCVFYTYKEGCSQTGITGGGGTFAGGGTSSTGKITGFGTALNTQSKNVILKCEPETGTVVSGTISGGKLYPNLKCTITNFNIPDNFEGISGSAKEYIQGFGDPNFLIYFQKFPQGEDSAWSGISAWSEGIATGMFVAMCTSSFIMPGAKKVGGFVVKRVTGINQILKAAEEAGLTTSEKKGLSRVIQLFKNNMKSLDNIYGAFGTGSDISQKGIFTSIKDALKDRWQEELIAKGWGRRGVEAAVRASVYAGTDAGAAYAASYIDSNVGKFVYENPKSLVLGMPLKKQEPTSIKTEFDYPSGVIPKLAKPIILDKDGQFVLASPCHADITVKNDKVFCGYYSYVMLTGMMECLDPKVIKSDSDIPAIKCGDFMSFQSSNGKVENGKLDPYYYSAIKSWLKNDKTLFKYEGNTVKQIIIPPFSVSQSISDMNIYFDIQNQVPCENKISTEYKCYDAIMNDGRQQTTPPEKLQLACGNLNILPEMDSWFSVQNLGFANNLQKFFDASQNIDDFVFCAMSQKEKDSQNGDLSRYAAFKYHMTSDMGGVNQIIWVKDKNDDKFYLTIIFSGQDFFSGGYMTVLKDSNKDTKWDNMVLFTNLEKDYYPSSSSTKTKTLVFGDGNMDGTLDSIGTANCWIDGVTTSVNINNYKSDKYNFCYGKASWKGYATTAGTIAIDAAAKAIPSPVAWVAGAAANCGLAYYELKTGDNWPYGGVGG